MLQQCSLDEIPGWAKAEFTAMGCLSPKVWHTRGSSPQRFVPKFALFSREEIEPDAPSQPEDGRWIFEAAMVISETFPETSVVTDWSSSGVYRREYIDRFTIYEPGFAFTARLTLQRPIPEDRLSNPTAYPVVRIDSSSPLTVQRKSADGDDESSGYEVRSGISSNISYYRYFSADALMDGFANASLLYDLYSNDSRFKSSIRLPSEFLPFSLMKYIEKLEELTYIEHTFEWREYIGSNASIDTYFDRIEGWRIAQFEQSHIFDGRRVEIPDRFEEIFDSLTEYDKCFNKTLVTLIKKLHKGPVDIGIMLAEMKSTASMTVNRFGQLISALDAVRRRDPVALGKALLHTPKGRQSGFSSYAPTGHRKRKFRRKPSNDPGSLFLEYNFGWKQLYNDLNGLIQVLFTQMYKLGQIIHVTSYEVSDNRIGNYITGRPPQGGRTLKSLRSSTTSKEVTIFRGSDKEVLIDEYDYNLTVDIAHEEPIKVMNAVRLKANFKVHDVNEKLLQSIGIKNPFVAAWDIVPYSFIADWVLNLDAIIKSSTYDGGLKELPSTVTSFWYVPTVAFVYSGDPADPWIQRPKSVSKMFFSFRNPIQVSDLVDDLKIGDIISTASAPTRLFQLGVFSAMAVQRLSR